jgi:hypothetical protein
VSRNPLKKANLTRFTLITLFAFVAFVVACTKENVSSTPTEPHVASIEGATSSLNDAGPRRRDFTQPAPDNEPSHFSIRLERQACYGVCPVYTIDINESGGVRYVGAKYVNKRGEVTKQLSTTEMDRLKKEFESIGFFALSWKDPCSEMWTDNATVIVTLVSDGRKRTIEHYHGNKCFPEKLTALEKAIDDIVGSAAWTKCPRGADGYDFCDR